MNEATALILYTAAIVAVILYTLVLGRWVQAQHNRSAALGCLSLALAVALTAGLAWLAFYGIGR